MNKFFDFIQPTIIKSSNHASIPEALRNKYFVNFNVFSIHYFNENYLLHERETSNFMFLLKEDRWGLELEESYDSDVIDIPRVYIPIDDKFVNDESNTFMDFVSQGIAHEAYWLIGIEGFRPGVDYYVNNTLYNYLANSGQIETAIFEARLPNYLVDDTNGIHISEAWQDLSDDPLRDYKNLEYFNEKNKLSLNTFTEDELDNFYSTFCKIILKYTKISDLLKDSGNNTIYNLVLNYYANFQYDNISNAINLVLNNLYAKSSNTTNCGCNTAITGNNSTTSTETCGSMYKSAMFLYLKQMLGDPQFYEDWFKIQLDTDYLTNDVLVAKLNKLFEEFLLLQNTLSFVKTTNKLNCECPNISLNENDCNYNIIKNYKKVLGFVADNTVMGNRNKIKIWGEQFAELLPKLQF